MRGLPLDSPRVDHSSIEAWERHLGARVTDPDALRTRLSQGTLPEAFAGSARRHARSSALTVNGRTISHGEVNELAANAAARFGGLGMGTEHRILLIADVGLEEIAAYLGGLRIGATMVLVNPALTSPELKDLATASEASMLVGSGPALAAASGIRTGTLRELVGLRPVDQNHSSAQLDLARPYPTSPLRPVDPDSTAILAFTSGKTGRPKPTPLSHRNLLASIRAAMQAWRWTEHDHLVHSLPISHQHGLSGVHATFLAGSRATLLGRFDAEATLEAVEHGGASIHFGVAAIHQRLLERLGDKARRLSVLRLAISGSGPLPIDLFKRYASLTGNELLERYGTTESGLDVSNLYDGPRLPGHVGVPLPGIEIALVGDEGEVKGEILIRGPQVFSGYLAVSRQDQPFVGDWFRTGDIGTIDERTGVLRIVGRTKEVIISGGMNVYPREVEDAIRSFPGVEDVAVTGLASDNWGEELVAVVSPCELDDGALADFLAGRLAGYKRPKRIVTADTIPRNSVGKLITSELIKLIPSSGSASPPTE